MIFGGSASAMIQSIRGNRAQLNSKNRKGYFEKDVQGIKNEDKFVDHKKMSPAQFAAFKAKVAQDEKDRLRKLSISFGAVVVGIVAVVVYFLFYFRTTNLFATV